MHVKPIFLNLFPKRPCLSFRPTWYGTDNVHGSVHGRILSDGIGRLDKLIKDCEYVCQTCPPILQELLHCSYYVDNQNRTPVPGQRHRQTQCRYLRRANTKKSKYVKFYRRTPGQCRCGQIQKYLLVSFQLYYHNVALRHKTIDRPRWESEIATATRNSHHTKSSQPSSSNKPLWGKLVFNITAWVRRLPGGDARQGFDFLLETKR